MYSAALKNQISLGFLFVRKSFLTSSVSFTVNNLIHNQRPSCNCSIPSINLYILELNSFRIERAFSDACLIDRLVQAEQKLLEAMKILESIENWVGVASAYELKAKVNGAKDNAKLAREDLLKAISFYEKQGMKEKADSLKKNMEKTSEQKI